MTLPKESLHSPAMQDVLAKLRAHIKDDSGLKVEELKDVDIKAMYELGYNLYQSYSYKDSLEIFRRLCIARPYEPKFWFGLASSFQMMNKFEEALMPWTMLCLVDPNNPMPHFHAAECLISLKNFTRAKEALFTAEKLDSDESFSGKIAALRAGFALYEEASCQK